MTVLCSLSGIDIATSAVGSFISTVTSFAIILAIALLTSYIFFSSFKGFLSVTIFISSKSSNISASDIDLTDGVSSITFCISSAFDSATLTSFGIVMDTGVELPPPPPPPPPLDESFFVDILIIYPISPTSIAIAKPLNPRNNFKINVIAVLKKKSYYHSNKTCGFTIAIIFHLLI